MQIYLIVALVLSSIKAICRLAFLASGKYPRIVEEVEPATDAVCLVIHIALVFWTAVLLRSL